MNELISVVNNEGERERGRRIGQMRRGGDIERERRSER